MKYLPTHVAEHTRWYGVGQSDKKEKVCLGVDQTLAKVVPSPLIFAAPGDAYEIFPPPDALPPTAIALS